MKQYCNFRCDSNMGHGYVQPFSVGASRHPLTLETLQADGWRVINNAIHVDPNYRGSQPEVLFVFLLEYEWPTDDPVWRK